VKANVQPHPGDPVTVHERIAAKKVTEPTPGTYIFDLGQNMVGVARLKLKNVARGTKEITLRQMERLNPRRHALHHLPARRSRDRHLHRQGREGGNLEPKFTFHCFQTSRSRPRRKSPTRRVEGVVLHTDMPAHRLTSNTSNDSSTSSTTTSSGARRATISRSPPTARSATSASAGPADAQFFINTDAYNFDVAAFFRSGSSISCRTRSTRRHLRRRRARLLGGHGNVAWGDAGHQSAPTRSAHTATRASSRPLRPR
jgi:alpha-L-rhamnosidase